MMTSLNKTLLIEAYLLRAKTSEESILFEARLLLHPELREKTFWQKKTYEFVQAYGRKQLRAEIEAIHNEMLYGPGNESFKTKIFRLFSKR